MREGWEISLALTLDYGQRSASRESEAAQRISSYLKVPHRVVSLGFFKDFFEAKGLLSTNDTLPAPRPEHLSDRGFSESSANAVWVPNRNGIFLEIAAGIAEASGSSAVIVGFNREEAETFPDNSTEYMAAINRSLDFSTRGKVHVISPTARYDKTELVQKAVVNSFPLHLIWSCYEGGEKMCGVCESCQRLKRALRYNEVSLHEQFDH